MNKKILILIIVSVILLGTNLFRIKSSNSLPFYQQYTDSNFLEFFGMNSVLYIRLLLFFIGILNTFLLYTVLEKLNKDSFTVSFLWVLSPVFLYFHSAYTKYTFSFAFFLLGLVFVLSGKHIISLIFFIISCLITQNMFLVVLISIFILLEKQKNKVFWSYLGILFVSYLFTGINNYQNSGVHSLITRLFSDLGADLGLGIFPFLLGIIGLIVSWKDKKENFIFYFVFACFGILSLYDNELLLFLNLLLVYYSALGINYLMERKWDSEVLKTYVIIIFICGILFSAGSYIKRISEFGPYEEELLSFKVINEEGIVFSHYKYGHMIKKVSGNDAYTDYTYFSQSENKEKINITYQIFKSRDYKKIREFFKKNNIKYVWINKEMKSGLVFKNEEDGMLLVLKNNFKKIYDYKGTEVWKLPE